MNKDIVCLSTIDWNFAKQRHQIFMEMFAKNGGNVIFVEHLGFSRQQIKDMPRIIRRITRALNRKGGGIPKDKKNPNITIITPLLLPPVNKMCDFLNDKIFSKLLARRILKSCRSHPAVWTYLATSTVLSLAKKLSPGLIVYDCVYDALEHPDAPPGIKGTEKELLNTADIVFTDAGYLYKLKKKYNDNTYRVPPGVDFEHFNVLSQPHKEVPLDIKDMKGPRICSFGSIDKMRIDLDLIDTISRERPDWSIIMIGAVVGMKIPDKLLRRKNIAWLGAKNYKELPSYLSQCDALILPYKLNKFTRSILPAKIFECLATGKPTVSTPLPELEVFKDLITITGEVREFIKGIEDAISHDTDEAKKNRTTFAEDNSWDKRFEVICEKMEQVLNKKVAT